MNTVTINASTPYNILIGSGLLSSLGERIHTLGGIRRVCIVSDSNVFSLYGNEVKANLEAASLDVSTFLFPAGETAKNGYTYLELLNHLAENHLNRTDAVLALGGGVVGDLAGFAAATFLRGIRYIQVPTTLLAAVDSSVGGKTAIDLPSGKNLAGAFHPPCLVVCDTDTLSTLPEDIYLDGCAEIIKYAVLYDPDLFEYLRMSGISFDRETVILRCVQHKKSVVERDERENGERRMLNLGHTIGHCIEAASNYDISHGKAVSIGTAIVTSASVHLGICNPKDAESIISLLRQFGLPVSTSETAATLHTYAMSDKKRVNDVIHFILPHTIGNCGIHTIPVSELTLFLEKGLRSL